MSLVNVSGLSFRYPSTPELFRDVTFSVDPGDRLAIVGPNGAGKSTLLALLGGRLEPVEGTIARRRQMAIATAEQQPANGQVSLFDFVFGARAELAALRSRLAQLEHHAPCEFAETVNEYSSAGGYAAEAHSERILEGLGLVRAEWELPLASLSGGQRTRAALARALHANADLLLLDEPTNHLDVAAREWLDEQLASGPACVFVSHDRTLLRKVSTRVLEIERQNVRLFQGGYDSYRSQRATIARQAQADYESFGRRRAAAEAAAEKRSRLAAKVATAPAGERHGHDFYRAKAARVARTGRILRERVERGPAAAKPWEEQPVPVLEFSGVRRSGDIAVSVHRLAKSYPGKPLFEDVSFELRRGERLAITGPNGAGKTTLLRLLLGAEPPDGGSIRLGADVTAGHYAQDAENLDRASTPLEICGSGTLARTLLACLKVRPDRVAQPLGQASAGECAKVALVRLLVSGANLLVLDEPTNHLDIESQEALEKTLAQYPGAIVLVSHDRALLETLAPERILRL